VKRGDLVVISYTFRPISSSGQVRGFQDYPGEYHYHRTSWVDDGALGIILEVKDEHVRVIVQDCALWFGEESIGLPTKKRVACEANDNQRN